MALCNAVGVHDFSCAPFAGPPVEDFPLLDQLVHGPHRFFHGGLLVWPVAKEQVEVVDPQSLEGVVTGLGHVLCGAARVGWEASACAKKDLGGDAPGVPWPVALAKSLPMTSSEAPLA